MPPDQIIITLLVRAFILLTILPVHEFAHAISAYWLGDRTAKVNGRLTLDPIKHIDPIGGIMIMLLGFGWAKPVPVNPYNFKNRKAGMALTAAAGPLSNLIAAFIGIIVFYILAVTGVFLIKPGVSLITQNVIRADNAGWIAYIVLRTFISVNVTLAIFNLIPINPLDGSRILALVLPRKAEETLERYGMYFQIGVFALIAIGLLSGPLMVVSNAVIYGFSFIIGLPFGFPPVSF